MALDTGLGLFWETMEYLIRPRNDDFDVRSKFSSNFENLPFLHPDIPVSADLYVVSADPCLVSVSPRPSNWRCVLD
jgi:hypothetical protein